MGDAMGLALLVEFTQAARKQVLAEPLVGQHAPRPRHTLLATQLTLDGSSTGLDGPTGAVGALVADIQPDAHSPTLNERCPRFPA